jgi:mono/diheme cytochrome c family protein
MPDIVKSMFIVLVLAVQLPQGAKPASSPVAPTTDSDRGKDIFVNRCAKCHDQDANKKLPDGTTLLLRLANSKDPEARLGTRIKSVEERREVMLYVQSLIAQLRSSQAEMKAH